MPRKKRAPERKIAQEKIIERLIEGLSFTAACAKVGVPRITAYKWLRSDPEFLKSHDIAREIQADHSVDQIMELIDSLDPSEPDFQSKFFKTRLKIDSIKWVAGKQRPKKYSDKLAVSGDGDGAPLQVVIQKFSDGPDKAS